MKKAEFIAKMSEKNKFTKRDNEIAYNTFISVLEEAIVSGEKVQFVGFGSFEAKHRKPRLGRNPKKPDETVMIEASRAPVFKPGKPFKDMVNKK